jgi:hypothetical protein
MPGKSNIHKTLQLYDMVQSYHYEYWIDVFEQEPFLFCQRRARGKIHAEVGIYAGRLYVVVVYFELYTIAMNI